MPKDFHHINIYVDETGDRGQSPESSPIFGMASVLVSEAGKAPLQDAVTQLRSEFKVPADRPMSWKKDVKKHDRARRASEVLACVDGIRVCYVYAVKSQLRENSYKSDPARFYNYVALHTYTASLWAARDWKGSSAKVWTRFGHVKGHDHGTAKAYVARQAEKDSRVPSHMEQGLRWVSANDYFESQAADLFCGFLKSAIWPSGDFGYTEPSYLHRAWPQVHNSGKCAIPLGLHSMPNDGLAAHAEWLPCGSCSAKSRYETTR